MIKSFVAVVASPTGAAHTLMATEALKKIAVSLGYKIKVETQDIAGSYDVLSVEEIALADAVILAADRRVEMTRFVGKPVYGTTTGEAIRNTKSLIESAAELSGFGRMDALCVAPGSRAKKIVAVTACSTGIAHTFIAAECLQKAARALGHGIKVETQGSIGAKNTLTTEEIIAADAVVIAADTKVDTSRFVGKRLYFTSTKHAIHGGKEVLAAALAQPVETTEKGPETMVREAKAIRTKAQAGPYKHLLTGVSYMLPVVVAGGLLIALAFAVGGIYAGEQKEDALAGALSLIGGGIAFQLFVAVLSGFIAFSIADRPGITSGLIGGMLAQHLGAGFLGGIASGFLAGYLTKFLADKIRLPTTLEGLKAVLILPFLSSLLVGLAMVYFVAPPVHIVLETLTGWLRSMQGANALLLGMLLGGMMAFDMGGPVNKAAYTFALGMLASKVYTPVAAVMVAGMTPSLGLAFAAWLFKNRFDVEERKAAGPAIVLGVSFITEGAIPFAAKDPFRVIPALVVGSAVSGAISMFYNVEFLVPHGGVFAVIIPGAVKHLLAFFVALAAGTLVTTALLFALKRPLVSRPEEVK